MSTLDLSIWHKYNRLAHTNPVICAKVIKKVTGKASPALFHFCEACKQGKMHQKPHISQSLKTTKPFQIIHSDLWGPAYTASRHGFKYYIHFVDDYTRFTWIFPLMTKSDAAAVVKSFVKMIQCQFHTNIKTFQSNWGGNTDQYLSHILNS